MQSLLKLDVVKGRIKLASDALRVISYDKFFYFIIIYIIAQSNKQAKNAWSMEAKYKQMKLTHLFFCDGNRHV